MEDNCCKRLNIVSSEKVQESGKDLNGNYDNEKLRNGKPYYYYSRTEIYLSWYRNYWTVKKHFYLDKHCVWLLGAFDSQFKMHFQRTVTIIPDFSGTYSEMYVTIIEQY